MVGQRTLNPFILVRIQVRQPRRAPHTDRGVYLACKGLPNLSFSIKTFGPRKHPQNPNSEAMVHICPNYPGELGFERRIFYIRGTDVTVSLWR